MVKSDKAKMTKIFNKRVSGSSKTTKAIGSAFEKLTKKASKKAAKAIDDQINNAFKTDNQVKRKPSSNLEVSTAIIEHELPEWADPTPTNRDITETIKTIDAPEPCGFSFVNVPVKIDRLVNTETGEVRSENEKVRLYGDNLFHVIKAIETIAPIANETIGYVDNWIFPKRWIPDLIASSLNQDSSVSFNGTIEIESLTPSGKVKKYPVNTELWIDFKYPFIDNIDGKRVEEPWTSALCKLSFFPNGKPGKSRIAYHGNGFGICTDVDIDKHGEYFLKQVRVIVPPSRDWLKVYPQ